MGRLDPTKTGAQPAAATEVSPYAAMVVKRYEARKTRLKKMKWAEGEAPGPDASQEEKEAYRKFYEEQTSVNGCSVPGVSLAQEGSPVAGYRSPENVQACNTHDVGYGRGGSGDDRKAADEALYREIKANGQPVRARVTYAGVRVFGWMFFSYRDKGPLPIPEGK
jgi:hypothetical protein